MTKDQQRTIAIGAAIVLVVLVAATMLVIRPQWSNYKEAKTVADTAEQQAAAAQTEAASLQAKAAAIPDTIREVNKLTEQFPTEIKQSEWFDMIIDSADFARVMVRAISPAIPTDTALFDPNFGGLGQVGTTTPAPAASSVGEFPVAVSAASLTTLGSLEEHVAFLAALEGMERPLTVRQLTVNSEEMSLAGTTYLTRPLAEPEGLDLPTGD